MLTPDEIDLVFINNLLPFIKTFIPVFFGPVSARVFIINGPFMCWFMHRTIKTFITRIIDIHPRGAKSSAGIVSDICTPVV